jgi:hypothetical protein
MAAPPPALTRAAHLRALAGTVEHLADGNREIDATLWWLFADHAETEPAYLAMFERHGAAHVLDQLVGPRAWRDQAPIGLAPRLSTSLDALRLWTHTHLPGWARKMQEPGGDQGDEAQPSVSMERSGYDTGALTAPTLPLAAFRAAVQACLAREDGLLHGR